MELREGYKKTEVGVIPEDWECVNFSEVLKIRHGKSQHEITSIVGKYPILATGGIIGYTNSYLYDKPSVLIGRKGTIDVPQYMDTPFWTIDTLFYSEINNKAIAKYIYYLFNTIDWYKFNEASGVPSLNAKTIEGISFSVPPLSEQQAIATSLSDMDGLINSITKLIDKKKNIKQGTMQELFTRERRLDGFSGEWVERTLGEICEIKDGTHQTPRYVYSGVPFYSVESVTKNEFINTKFISKDDHLCLTKSYRIEKGDILMTRIGSIGDCKYIDWDADASFYVSLALLKVNQGFNGKFIYQYSNSNHFKKEIEINSLLSAIPKKINLGPISNVRLFIPENKEEQQAIATVLSDMDNEIQTLEQKLTKFKNIKQGMMQELLTGNIRLV